MALGGGSDDGLIIKGMGTVVGVADEVDVRVTDGTDHGGGVLLDGTEAVALLVNAGNADVKIGEIALVQIDGAFIVDDVQLGTQQQLDAVKLTGNDLEISKIDIVAGAGDAAGVLGDAEELDTCLSGGLCHFADGAVGVAADEGVGVCVYL